MTTPEEIIKVTTADQEAAGELRAEVGRLPGPAAEASSGDLLSSKRAFRRLNQKINVRYSVLPARGQDDATAEAEYRTVTRNLSAGGILFAAFEAPALGSVLELTIEIPDGKEPVHAHARVVRVEEVEHLKKYDVAVCLLDVTGGERARLNRYVESVS